MSCSAPPPARRAAAALACVLLAALLVESAAARPNYLAYFNPTFGGTAQSYRYVVDSNNDWGQELPALKTFLDQQKQTYAPNIVPSYYSVFGLVSPSLYGIEGVDLGSFYHDVPTPLATPLSPGIYCISASVLQAVHTYEFGPWDKDREATYQFLLPQIKVFWQRNSVPQYGAMFNDLLQRIGDDEWSRRLDQFRTLRLDRLCSYLRTRRPDANINGSILIFYLQAGELQVALEGPPRELREHSMMWEMRRELAERQRAGK